MFRAIINDKEGWQKVDSMVSIALNKGLDFEVTLDTKYKEKEPKTHPQLKYLHGQVLDCLKTAYELQDGMTYTKEAAKLKLKYETGYGEWCEFMLRGIPIKQFVPNSYSDAKKVDLMHAIDKAKEICLDYNIIIPEPSERWE